MKNNRFILVITLLVLIALTGCKSTAKADVSVDVPEKSLLKEVFSKPNGVYKGKVQEVEICATGDIILHGAVIDSAYQGNGNYNFDSIFDEVDDYIEKADIAIGNFESTTGGGRPMGYPMFNAPDEILETLQRVGYDILVTANNHALDSRKDGLFRTIDEIHANNMENVGTYKDEESSEKVLLKDVNGIKVLFLSYTYGLNGMESTLTDEEREYIVNLIDEDAIRGDILKAKELGSDFIIVFIHWGNEYQLSPSAQQRDLADKMFEWGADIILGSHPHVIQESQVVQEDGRTKFVIFSMGNFLSNQRRETLNSIINSKYTEDGVIVNIKLKKDIITNESKISSIEYVPTWVHRTSAGGTYQYQILQAKDDVVENLDTLTKQKLENSYLNTMSKMAVYKDLGEIRND